jgi:type I restriction enzyme S subunit
MSKYKFEDFAINSTQKKVPDPSEYSTYIGLEHMDTKSINVKRWGSDVPIIGEKLVMHKGDILLGKRNAYLRRAAIAPHDGIFSAHGMILRPKDNIVDYDFFSLFIASDYFFDEAIRISVGSLSPTINWKDLKELKFNLPSLETQKSVAKVLWSINNTIESYKELMQKSDDLIKARFQELFDNDKYESMKFGDALDMNNQQIT